MQPWMRHVQAMLQRFQRDESGAAIIEAALSVMLLIIMMFGIFEVTSYIRARDHVNKVADQMAELLATQPYWPPELVEARRSSNANMVPVMSAAGPQNVIGQLVQQAPPIMAGSYGMRVMVRFCDGLINSDSTKTEYAFNPADFSGTAGAPADCSGGVFTTSSALRSDITCADVSKIGNGQRMATMQSLDGLRTGAGGMIRPIRDAQPGQQHVVVYAGCTYRSWLKVFSDSGNDEATVTGTGDADNSVLESVSVIPMRNKMNWEY